MKIISLLFVCATCTLLFLSASYAKEVISLQKYTCSQFLKDSASKTNGTKVLKSLMMISWATGYAAAHQAGVPRADTSAINLIAGVLGNACRKDKSKTVVATIAGVITHFISAAKGQVSSRWVQDGSILDLVENGLQRRFYYGRPAAGMTRLGVSNGVLLFDGKKVENRYEGTAYTFARSCSPQPYKVSGDIGDHGKQITLRGKAPELDAKCHVRGYREKTLVFNFEQPMK